MTQATPTPSRREQILQALALMLEEDSGKRITVAALAKQVGVSEAALYRHFPSKARMFEGLIEFIEETLFARITRILEESPEALPRCGALLAAAGRGGCLRHSVLFFSDGRPMLAADPASRKARRRARGRRVTRPWWCR